MTGSASRNCAPPPPLALGSPGTSQRELAPQYAFVRAGGGLALVGELAGDPGAEGVTHVRVDHPVFRQREAQVQTALGRRLPWPAARFTESLVATPGPGRPSDLR
ncbi:hypothetical protein AQJ67_18270 [Streptomyces caeruleatus]|uniref:Uncharacterized protein n=1 Tax=Streptomyces caeruleatus TaxID=661399 RepID=A0A101U391_9ACTN|nr:hypothetical protein AQJ67_18270 [Streptomyces caeruleatus]